MKAFNKLFFIITILSLFGHVQAQNNSSEQNYSDLSVSIKYQNRTIYYPDSDSEENPINVHITLKNKGSQTVRFKLADDRAFSIDFQAMTVRNTQLLENERLVEKRTTNTTVYFREISLESGEEYSFTENLRDYIQITEPSVYYLQMIFYPELYKSKYNHITSGRLTLEIKPSPLAASSNVISVGNSTNEILTPQDISPDKVVESTIIARQKSQWDQYFLYMDLESLLERTPSLSRRYRTVSSDERERMISSFKADMMQSRIENDIIAIPETFVIQKTTYTPSEGSVEVLEWFKYPNFREKKLYTYKVRQNEGIWQIYDYTVVNLGTE